MRKPFLKNKNLVVPIDCPQQYQWWNGGQSITETLNELNAPLEVRQKYANRGGMKK